MTREQLNGLRSYMDIRINFLIDQALGRPTAPSWQYEHLDKQLEDLMLVEDTTTHSAKEESDG